MVKAKRSYGFTLAEMLVVIVILGILTGLSVFGYRGWQQGLAQRQVQSELRIAVSAMENAKNFGNGYPATLPSSYKAGSSATVSYGSGSASSYCLDGISNSNSSVEYFISSSNKEPVAGTCAGGANIPGIGETWVARTAAQANSWRAITYGNGLFVAVASDGTNRVMTSPDGITWTARTAAQANSWRAITYGNGLFVALSTDGTSQIMTSPDGITWTARTATAAKTWSAIAYGNGKFLALSSESSNFTGMYSTDGITWTSTNYGINTSFDSIVFAKGIFVAAGSYLTSGHNYSTSDAITWTRRTVVNNASNPNTIAFGGGKFVILSWSGGYVNTSSDGLTWSQFNAAEPNGWSGLAFGNGRFVAVAYSGTSRVMTSE